ncbi:MAG: acyl-CoA reductase [Bacteroidales bacterium]|jgi:hypothetical protein|nr:acyl-CoA reductase [Bacteroidales bacterium]
MDIADRINSFIQLGEYLRRFSDNHENLFLGPLITASHQAFTENPWFTPDHINLSIKAIGQALEPGPLHQWLDPYLYQLEAKRKTGTIGVVMPGNIPAVGFHDMLCVLMTGNKLKSKLSDSDKSLLPAIAQILIQIQPRWEGEFEFISGKLENFNAVIATGSDNTSRYFEYYFGKYPHIIRKNRNSIAVLNGVESETVLQKLADDIMLFFGMGCRNVSKLYVPAEYDFSKLKQALASYNYFTGHNKYANNYEYQKLIFMMNKLPFLDTGSLLIRENRAINSPIAVLNYQIYTNIEEVTDEIRSNLDSIQCIISGSSLPFPTVSPGNAQFPALWDYADHVDTMTFLLSCFSS